MDQQVEDAQYNARKRGRQGRRGLHTKTKSGTDIATVFEGLS
jgi:hypothetical protein